MNNAKKVTINDRKFLIEEEMTILEVARKAGIEIPTLCDSASLLPYGACRICLVEILAGGKPGLTTACQYKIIDGLVVKTDTEEVIKARKIILELILARTPDAEAVTSLARKYGINKSRIIKKETDDCILCGLCVRICQERMGHSVLSFSQRGAERKIGPAFDKTSPVCMGCGACTFICPTGAVHPEVFCEKKLLPLVSEFDAGLGQRPVINVMYPQAVPNVPAIDSQHCVHLNSEQCKICETVCEANAIDYSMTSQQRQLDVGAVLLSPGFDLFDVSLKGEYGYGIYPNVISSKEFERILSASGPTQGEILRPSDGKHPKKIAFISCVGSRDQACGNEYCSSVCCMYSTKEAIIAKEHEPDIEPTIFYMDMRAFGKGFETYYNNAGSKYGINYINCMASKLVELQQSNNLRIRYMAENHSLQEDEFELVILAAGIQASEDAKVLATRFGIELNEWGFCAKPGFSPTNTSRQGVYVSGAFGEPKDIPESVIEASSAAAEASSLLAAARSTLTVQKEYPEEKPFIEEEPRIGVYICRCGRNIGGVVDVPSVVEAARELPYVVFADENLYSCSQDSLEKLVAEIKEYDLTRVVVASCTPTTHASLFRETVREAGLNPYLFEMASLREHVSWVHMHEPEKATLKAKDIVAMAVAKAGLLKPVKQQFFDLNKAGLVIGGGLSGLTSALSLAEQGFGVHLIEKTDRLGGHLNDIYYTLEGKDTTQLLKESLQRVEENELIQVYKSAEIKNISGYLGNFRSEVSLQNGDGPVVIEHGIVIIATGAKEIATKEYLYGQNPKVVTQAEIEKQIAAENTDGLKKVVMIQCVGSRDDEHPYCSRVCCSQAVKNALKIKELDKNNQVFVLYRDIRTYGFKEKYYLEARRQGVVFLQYDEKNKPQVTDVNGELRIECRDKLSGQEVNLSADKLVLSTGMYPDNEDLSRLLKLPLTGDGFFMEAHAKIRPLDFNADGMYLAGLSHSPRTIEESIAQAKGATIRAATILSKDKILAKAELPEVKDKWCTGCAACVKICPYDARQLNEETNVSEVIEVLCQACGACSVACTSGVSEQKGFEKTEIFAMIDTGLEE